jgi:hypothetical protein
MRALDPAADLSGCVSAQRHCLQRFYLFSSPKAARHLSVIASGAAIEKKP